MSKEYIPGILTTKNGLECGMPLSEIRDVHWDEILRTLLLMMGFQAGDKLLIRTVAGEIRELDQPAVDDTVCREIMEA